MNFKTIVPAILALVAGIIAATAVADTPQVQNVTAKQRFPWNGLVDITCTVTGIDGTTNWLELAVATVMPDSGNVRSVFHYWMMQNGTKTTDCMVHTNGDYRLLWDAQADLGLGVYSNIVVRVTVVDLHSKVQLWEGGPYWAERNIGAKMPWEGGYYFWWGDTVGYKYENNVWVASDGSSSGFSFGSENTPTYDKDLSSLQSEGWITADNVLASEHDAARAKWGGRWRMPTNQELSGLNNNCDWTWATTNGVNGYVVRGRGAYASASIFLPCAGYGNGTSLDYAGSYGYYWFAVPYSDYSYYAWYLRFDSSYHDPDSSYRDNGQSVRPVQGFTE